MNKISLAIAAVALLASASTFAAGDLKIGLVKLDKVFKEAAPAVRAQKKLEKEFAARDQELQKLGKQARDLQSLLEKEAVTMSDSDRRDKEQELARMTRELQRMQREFREDLNLRRNEEMSAVLQRAQTVIQQIAEAEKFDLILQDAVYISPRIDITDKVIKALGDK
ncbi:MAG TPA: OmpH family outer membrane protein [Burkholderiales bacterium]|nr:OmpH family outer membrane protein [Burkholderiales bacterium]